MKLSVKRSIACFLILGLISTQFAYASSETMTGEQEYNSDTYESELIEADDDELSGEIGTDEGDSEREVGSEDALSAAGIDFSEEEPTNDSALGNHIAERENTNDEREISSPPLRSLP